MADLASVAKQIKAELEELRPRSTTDCPIPFGRGRFFGRFGVLSQERYDELIDKMDDEDGGLLTACLIVAESCRQICYLNGSDVPEPITYDGRPVRFDESFAEIFDLTLDEKSMAAVVRECWKLDNGEFNGLALREFTLRLVDWMGNTMNPVTDEIVGESQGGRP